MLITKLSYLGAAGLGLALTLGGVRTLAFQAQPARPAESAPAAKPKKSAPAGPQRERSLNEVQVAAEVSEINTLIRWDQVERDLRHSADSISKLQEELVKLKAEVKESQSRYAEYQAVRRRLENPPPTPATPTPAPAPTPATPVRARPDAEAERPQYLSLGRSMVVISPDGSRASLYDLHGDKFKPLPLPPMAGVRREFLFPKHLLFPNAYRRPGQVTNPVASPWCVALELDQDRKVVKIVAVNIQDGSHAATTPPTPFPDRSSVSTPRPDIVVLGGGMVAFSSTAKKWGALSGVTSGPEFDESGTWAESKGRLYRFNRATGEWDDLYARSLQTGEGMKYDTRYAPAQ